MLQCTEGSTKIFLHKSMIIDTLIYINIIKNKTPIDNKKKMFKYISYFFNL